MTRRLLIALLVSIAFMAVEHAFDLSPTVEAQRGGRGGGGGGGGGRGGKGGGGGGGAGKGGGKMDKGPKVDDIPSWHQQRKSTWEKALAKSQPIVLVFVGEKDKLNTKYWIDKAVSKISREDAVFVWIVEGESQVETNQSDQAKEVQGFGEDEDEEEGDAKKEKPEPKKWIEGSRYEQKNLWEAYKVTKPDTIIFADYWGNELDRATRKPSASTVERWVKELPKMQEKANENLTKAVKSAKDNWEKNKKDKAVKELTDLVNLGWVGFENIEAAKIALESYVKVGEEEFSQYWEKDELVKDIDLAKANTAIKELARVYANTRISESMAKALAAIEERLNPKKDTKTS